MHDMSASSRALSDGRDTPSHGLATKNNRIKSNGADFLPKGVMDGHALCALPLFVAEMAWFNNGAVAGFGSRKGRVVLGNGVSAIASRFTVCVLLCFLCASAFE